MRRRDFVAFLSVTTAWVATARAQEPRRVIGVLSALGSIALPETASIQRLKNTNLFAAFSQELKNIGFIEGRNLSIEWRLAAGQYDRLSSLAGDLVGRNVAVIVALDVPSSFAAKAATRTIPIVFAVGADPVRLGLVDSLNQPRDNLTGASSWDGALGPKQLDLLHELLPHLRTVALLVNPNNPNSKIDAADTQAAADALGLRLEVLTASTASDLDTAFTTMVRQRVDALVVKPDPFFIMQRERLVALAARHEMPAIYSIRVFVEVGGLMSYASSAVDTLRLAGTYTGKILKGAKPADLPVQRGIKFELAINLKTAKALGLTVPPELLARADEVIE